MRHLIRHSDFVTRHQGNVSDRQIQSQVEGSKDQGSAAISARFKTTGVCEQRRLLYSTVGVFGVVIRSQTRWR